MNGRFVVPITGFACQARPGRLLGHCSMQPLKGCMLAAKGTRWLVRKKINKHVFEFTPPATSGKSANVLAHASRQSSLMQGGKGIGQICLLPSSIDQ